MCHRECGPGCKTMGRATDLLLLLLYTAPALSNHRSLLSRFWVRNKPWPSYRSTSHSELWRPETSLVGNSDRPPPPHARLFFHDNQKKGKERGYVEEILFTFPYSCGGLEGALLRFGRWPVWGAMATQVSGRLTTDFISTCGLSMSDCP